MTFVDIKRGKKQFKSWFLENKGGKSNLNPGSLRIVLNKLNQEFDFLLYWHSVGDVIGNLLVCSELILNAGFLEGLNMV